MKACAMCGLRTMAGRPSGTVEDTSMSSGSKSPGFGDMLRWLPRKPHWKSDVESWTESEEPSDGASSDEEYGEHSVENLALEVVGQGWSGELVCLFLEDWELARVALRCQLAPDLLCQEMQDAWLLLHCLRSPLSQCLEVSLSLEGL